MVGVMSQQHNAERIDGCLCGGRYADATHPSKQVGAYQEAALPSYLHFCHVPCLTLWQYAGYRNPAK